MNETATNQSPKRCSRCQQHLPRAAFSKNKTNRDGLQYECRACQNAHRAARYKANTQERERITSNTRAAREHRKTLRDDYLATHPCVDCGEADIVVLEFDHVRGEKEFNISEAVFQQVSEERLRAEIAKCDVRCANCHRRATAQRAGWRRYTDRNTSGEA